MSSAIAFLIIGSIAASVLVMLLRGRPVRSPVRSVDDFHRAMRALAPRDRDR